MKTKQNTVKQSNSETSLDQTLYQAWKDLETGNVPAKKTLDLSSTKVNDKNQIASFIKLASNFD